jgi:GxxExxY protein
MVDIDSYNELTYAVIGCAMEVHKNLGCGFQELIYQRALAVELGRKNISAKREVEMPIIYTGVDIGTRRVDFLINNELIVEIKAVTLLEEVHKTQALNYLKVFTLEVALLINFGSIKMEYKRLIKPTT